MTNKPRGMLIDDKINTMSTQLIHRLREEIISGTLKPGSKINLALAREHFGVSLSPLREALARLVSDGLAEFEDNRGYRVAPVSLENLAEVTQLRTEFECSALRHAMTVGDVDWEADVMRDLYRLSRIARDPAHPETLAQWEAAHAEFHMTLIAGCNMPLLQNTCSHGDAGLRRRARRQTPERLRRRSRSWPAGRELRRPLRSCRRLRHGRRPRVHGLAPGRELPGRGSRGRGRGPAQRRRPGRCDPSVAHRWLAGRSRGRAAAVYPQRPALRRPVPATGNERGDHPGGPLRAAAAGQRRAAVARAAGGPAAGQPRSASRCPWTAAFRPSCTRSGSSTRPGSCSTTAGDFEPQI